MRKTLEAILAGGRTKRFHTVPTVEGQNVGCHSYEVAMLCQLLEPGCRKELILAALTHDIAEHVVGDVPAPTKRATVGGGHVTIGTLMEDLEDGVLADAQIYTSELTADEQRTLKLADYLSGMLTCIYERRMGNKALLNVYRNFRAYVSRGEADFTHGQRMAINEAASMWLEADK